jgi:hypothetical protein
LPGKKGHRLLDRLIRLTELRLPFTARRDQLVRQRQWLIELDRLLERGQDMPAAKGAVVAAQVEGYLDRLLVTTTTGGDEFDQCVAAHINQTFRNRWWGLFACYDVAGLPRTNNELETFLRRLKTEQRRITGRKNVHAFIVRYGRFVAFLDDSESQQALLARLRQVPLDDFNRERERLDMSQDVEQKRYRFRHRQTMWLTALEARWAEACALPATS